jgi:hypothetical protein
VLEFFIRKQYFRTFTWIQLFYKARLQLCFFLNIAVLHSVDSVEATILFDLGVMNQLENYAKQDGKR